MRNMRSDNGQQMRGNSQGGAGMKRRWDSAGGSKDHGHQNKRPFQANAHFSSNPMGGGMNAGGGFQPKPFRPNTYDQNKPAMSSVPSYQQPAYGKFSYTPMQMPPSLAQYPGIASAVANYTFPPPQSSVIPPLPKN